MLVTKGEHVNAASFIDNFGNSFVHSEELVQGY